MSLERAFTEAQFEENESFEERRERLRKKIEESIADEAEHLRLEKKLWELDKQNLLRQIKELQEQVTTDKLTQTKNRRGFEEEIGRILKTSEGKIMEKRHVKNKLSFLLLDIDNFKKINDTHGHAAGDEALKRVAEVLKGHAREGDIVSRLGGDEFVVVFSGAEEEDIMEKFFNKDEKKAEIGMDVDVRGRTIKITTSGGLTSYEPGEEIDDTIARADKALYASKKAGRNQITKYSEALEQKES